MNRKSILMGASAILLSTLVKPSPALAVTRIHLVNKQSNSVVVEVRRGDSTNPEENPAVPGSPFTIPKGGEQVIDSDGQDLFYRHADDPSNPTTGGWSSWSHQTVFPDHSEDLTANV